MKFTDMLRISLNGVMRGKVRTVLSALAVAIGAASILLISSLSEAGRQAVLEQFERLGISGLTLYTKSDASSDRQLTVSDVAYIKNNIDGITDAMPLIVQYGEYKLKNWKGNTIIWGVGDHFDNIINVEVKYGRLPSGFEINNGVKVAVIDDSLAKRIYKRENIVGKTFTLGLGGAMDSFEIIGIISSQKNGLNQLVGNSIPEFIYIPYTAVSQMSDKDYVDQIAISCMSGADLDTTSNNILDAINRRHGTENGYSIENISSYRNKLESIAGLVSLFMSAIAGISLGVAGLGVMNSMLSSTSERRREIGVCMAIGAQRRDIATCFLLEAAIICCVGGFVGIISGTLISFIVTKLISVAPVIKLEYILLSELISALFGLTFGVIPAVRASGLDPIVALREE